MNKAEAEKRLKQAKKEYEKICDKLDALNEEAFTLEQEMMWLSGIIRKGD